MMVPFARVRGMRGASLGMLAVISRRSSADCATPRRRSCRRTRRLSSTPSASGWVIAVSVPPSESSGVSSIATAASASGAGAASSAATSTSASSDGFHPRDRSARYTGSRDGRPLRAGRGSSRVTCPSCAPASTISSSRARAVSEALDSSAIGPLPDRGLARRSCREPRSRTSRNPRRRRPSRARPPR